MAVETQTEVEIGTAQNNWISAGIAGLAAGVVFGVIAGVLMPEMMGMVGALYGFEGSAVVGWIAHLVHSVIFGLIYAAIVSLEQFRTYAGRVSTGAGSGLVYGAVVWLVAAAIVMPLWIGAMTPATPPVPDFNVLSLIGHAVYGIILGAAYPLILVRMGQ